MMLDELYSGLQITNCRYNLNYCGYVWEIDVFLVDNRGMIVIDG